MLFNHHKRSIYLRNVSIKLRTENNFNSKNLLGNLNIHFFIGHIKGEKEY